MKNKVLFFILVGIVVVGIVISAVKAGKKSRVNESELLLAPENQTEITYDSFDKLVEEYEAQYDTTGVEGETPVTEDAVAEEISGVEQGTLLVSDINMNLMLDILEGKDIDSNYIDMNMYDTYRNSNIYKDENLTKTVGSEQIFISEDLKDYAITYNVTWDTYLKGEIGVLVIHYENMRISSVKKYVCSVR